MAGFGDHLNAAASQLAGSGPTREEFANLQQQLNQLCARLEQAGIIGAPNSTLGGQTRQNFRTYQQRNVRNQPAMEDFQQTVGDFSDEDGGVLPLEKQSMFHCTTDCDQNLNIKVDIPHFTGEEQLGEVLDWLNEVERVFEFLNLPENKKVKMVVIKLKGYTSSWWQQVQMTKSNLERRKSRAGLKCSSKSKVNSFH